LVWRGRRAARLPLRPPDIHQADPAHLRSPDIRSFPPFLSSDTMSSGLILAKKEVNWEIFPAVTRDDR
jgi:hypothetical protein